MSKAFGLKPLEDRIAVHPSEEDDTTASGLVIPDTAKERPQEGEVMAVRHRELPVDGVQFHPESVLTPLGPHLARNFLTSSASSDAAAGARPEGTV